MYQRKSLSDSHSLLFLLFLLGPMEFLCTTSITYKLQQRETMNIYKEDTEYFIYLVQDEEVLGRYGDDIRSAMGHISLYNNPKKTPDSIPNINRALILVNRKGDSLHPSQLTEIYKVSQEANCYWKDESTLQMMQRVAEVDHSKIRSSIQPRTNAVHRNSESYCENLRENCRETFEMWQRQLKESVEGQPSIDIVPDDDET